MPFDRIRPRIPDDDERILAIYNNIHADAPPMTVEEYRHFIESRPEGAGWEAWVAEENSEIVGSLDLAGMWLVQEPGAWEIWLYVDDDHAGRGIGSRLYQHMEHRARDLGAKRLYAEVREDRPLSLRFAERRGFAPTGRVERYVRLDVARARVDDLEEREERLRQEGTEILTLAQIGPENEVFMRALHAMYEAAMADIPRSEPYQPRTYEAWLESSLHWPGNSPEWCWVAIRRDADGSPRPLGIARLRRQGNAAFHGMTAVDRAYRGRGIAQALKRYTIRWAQQNGIAYLYTGNDVENLPMREINRQLGYEPLPGGVEVMKMVGG